MIPDTPKLAVDCIILVPDGLVLIERKYPPLGFALPGGFVDVGERCQEAAIREAKEETNLDVEIIGQLGIYDDPKRDPRGKHTVSVAYVVRAAENPVAGDDAKEAFVLNDLFSMPKLAFDHREIINDFIRSNYFPFWEKIVVSKQ